MLRLFIFLVLVVFKAEARLQDNQPNTPGKMMVWFRNETILMVLWQPPYPPTPGAYTHYKVSIEPPDARDSQLSVKKEDELPGPPQATFYGLVPGRAYNISVQTVSEPEISAPTTAQYRTIPLRPLKVTVPPADLKETSFRVTWLPPQGKSEFEKYQVLVRGNTSAVRRLAPVVRERNDTLACSFEGLEPGAPYTVTVKTMSSVGIWRTRRMKVFYTRTPSTATRFDSYRFRLEGAGSAPREITRAADAPGQTVEFAALVPGRLYNITMWTVSHNVTSHPVQRQARLYPRPITQLNATEVGAREVTLAWDKPAGDYTEFQVQYLTDLDQLQTLTTEELSITLGGLRPYTEYVFTVQVAAGRPESLRSTSRSHSAALHTLRAPPPPPQHFSVTPMQPSALNFSWQLAPADANGVLRRFLLAYGPLSQPDRVTELDFPANARSGYVTGLEPGATYWAELHAETGAGPGPAARATAHLDIGLPPRPDAHATPRVVRRSSSTITVRLCADYFSPANGNVTAYTLVLAEEARNDTPARLPSWRDVHALDAWPPYQVTEPYYPFHSSPVEEFTIGSERCDASGRAYCNGPLKPGTKYFVKLRAFTAPDNFTDTAYTVVYTDQKSTRTNILAYSLSAVGVLIFVVLLLVYLKARNHCCYRSRTQRPLPPLPTPDPGAGAYYENMLSVFAPINQREAEAMENHYEEIQ